jgi:ribose 5-phosphate isomerase RpiB
VKEESQIDDMRAALRGDRERAEQARQRSSENVLALIDAPVPEPRVEEAEPQARRGFFARLLGR